MPQLDLAELSALDGHCHPFIRQWFYTDLPSFRACFSEGRERMERFVPSLVYYQWALREMRRALGLAPGADEETILAARAAQADDYLAAIVGEARLGGLLVDDGYPVSEEALSVAAMGRACDCPAWRVLRLETLLESLLLRVESLDDLIAAFTAELADLRARGVVALKSIIAYRGGLDVHEPTQDAVRAAFTLARAEIAREGRVRLAGCACAAASFSLSRSGAGCQARASSPVSYRLWGYGP